MRRLGSYACANPGVGAIFVEFGHGGARPNSGGARPNSGGARPGAGRPRKIAAEPTPADVLRWYCVRAGFGQTAVADRSIREAGFEVFAPTIFRPATPARRDSAGVMRVGKPDRVEFLFVRYIITRFRLADPSWYDIRTLDGVERIISGSYSTLNPIGIPIAIPDDNIAFVREKLGPNDCIDPRVFRYDPIKVGTSLRMLNGPMSDRVGLCEMSDGQRIVLLMNLLGRPVRIEVPHGAVEPI